MGSTIAPVIAAFVAAAASVVAAVITAYFGHKNAKLAATATVDRQKLADLTRDLHRAYGQVSGYYQLEALAAERIAATTGSSAKTIKSELRDQVHENGFARPEWTSNECEKRLSALDA